MSTKVQFTIPFYTKVDEEIKKRFPESIDFRILSKSLDARGANKGLGPKYIYSIEYIKKGEEFSQYSESFKKITYDGQRPVIVGAGPAGLFCALRLIEYGIPSIIVERGDRAHKRMKKISAFWRYGQFDEENNVCYGEGGAGLFSDGKLITRLKSPHVHYVMKKLVDFGAPAEVQYLSNPHLGSNKIRGLINSITDYLRERGCEIHYHQRMEELLLDKNKVQGVRVKDLTSSKNIDYKSNHVVLAVGHSAREIYQYLKEKNVLMKQKDFAIGVRIEHLRRNIDKIQYGQYSDQLGASKYRVSLHDQASERGCYSFCMCPGGYVLSSGTAKDGIVVNGMSNSKRNSPWSNSALVVSVKAGEDFGGEDVLEGQKFIESIEQKAYQASLTHASGRELPAMTVKEFLSGEIDDNPLPSTSSPSGLFKYDLTKILPQFVIEHLRKGLVNFEKKMPGFSTTQALLIAPETRTSAPVTIVRNKEDLMSSSHEGLYPCGEGAGYAGGITSAAVDGIKIAESILKDIS